jgi:hypothetical protein
MKNRKFLWLSSFGLIGIILFSQSASGLNNLVSKNTPETGYLLCANKKTKAVTYTGQLTCPSGTVSLDLGAVQSTNSQSSSINSVSTFATVTIPSSPKLYAAVLPLRSSIFSAGAGWYEVSVKLNAKSSSSGLVNCQIMPMNSFSGDQNSGTTVNSSFVLFSGYDITQQFSGNFVYYGNDYVLACKTDMAVSINADLKVSSSSPVKFLN